MMVPNTPLVFKRMCQNFGPDLGEFVSSWEDLSLLALHNLEISEARSLAPFIEDLLSGRYSDEDLKEFWWTMPVTTVFDSGNEVRRLLQQIREALTQPPYAEKR
ncbi:MAG: hypothetical protein KDJ37_08345 [Hyphomicrobiaceae bacterium]|nr:hypothetical protein [Hyphomicrobiaceae bacterium]